jgi:hypothetical protein
MNHKNHKPKDRIIVFLLIFILPVVLAYFTAHHIDYTKLMAGEYNGVEVSGTMLGIWGAMLGFMITALSIIMTLGDGNFIKTLRGTTHFKTIMIIMILTCLILFFATVFGAAVVCFNFWSQICFITLLYFLFGTGIAIILSMLYLFFIVLNSDN